MASRIPLLSLPLKLLERWATHLHFTPIQSGRIPEFHDTNIDFSLGDKADGLMILQGRFDFAGYRLNTRDDGSPWHQEAPCERFAHWLHSFKWLHNLHALNTSEAHAHAQFLILDWVKVYGDWNSYAWQYERLIRRLYMWLSLWPAPTPDNNHAQHDLIQRKSTLKQLRYLRRHYKYLPPGLPKLQAACVICLAGARMKNSHESWLARGLDWLDDEINLQILKDGGHISRNPLQTFLALCYLHTLDRILEVRGLESSETLHHSLDRLFPAVSFFTGADGTLACFNGGGEADKTHIKKLLNSRKSTIKNFRICNTSHFRRIENNGIVILIDTGPPPPFPYSDQAHLAPLALEISTPAGRLVVNCGWTESQPGHWKNQTRKTVAHSTLSIDGHSAGHFLSPGWRSRLLGQQVTQGAQKVSCQTNDGHDNSWLSMQHDGYHQLTGLTHQRRLFVHGSGLDIRGEDALILPHRNRPKKQNTFPFSVRFHLHPSVRATLAQNQKNALLIQPGNVAWRFTTDVGSVRLESSRYLGRGHKPMLCQQLIISGNAQNISDGKTYPNLVRWRWQKLDNRAP